jgi:hypothetical protein
MGRSGVGKVETVFASTLKLQQQLLFWNFGFASICYHCFLNNNLNSIYAFILCSDLCYDIEHKKTSKDRLQSRNAKEKKKKSKNKDVSTNVSEFMCLGNY